MVIVRESPHAKEPGEPPQWPPRSPHEALLSSPSGRKRLERLREGGSPSPISRRSQRESPRKAMSIPSSTSDEDEDEETLQLKLKAIEAKLKLKKLQKARGSRDAGKASKDVGTGGPSRSGLASRSFTAEPPPAAAENVQVPLSPVRKQTQQLEPKSPARTLLGIDKGLKAGQVSLKRPRSTRPNISPGRAESLRLARERETPKIKSFSERLAESRLSVLEQQAKDERVLSTRSQGFNVQKPVDHAAESTVTTVQPRNSAQHDRKDGSDSTSETVGLSTRTGSIKDRLATRLIPSSADTRAPTPNDAKISSHSAASSRRFDKAAMDSARDVQIISDTDATESATMLEPYSGIHLSKRHIEHTVLTRTLQGKELYPLPRLLHEIKGPQYEPPDCESDYVVLGAICSKSTPREHANNPKAINTAGRDEYTRPKFMVFRLTDFKYEIDVFLFDTGFERWWKLKEGTVIAILNPGIMPPKRKDTDAFSLKVTSSEDTVLEIGQARDLGFCKAMKADGNQCTAWVDKRKTEVCEYHISLQVDKARADRMQFGTMTGGPGAGRGGRGGSRGGRGGAMFAGRNAKNGLAPEGKYHDRFLHETVWITPQEMGLNTAKMLDREFADKIMDKEAKRQLKRSREKEEELARSLGLRGNGTGSEYLKHRSLLKDAKDSRTTVVASSQNAASSSTAGAAVTNDAQDAASLGLLGRTAADVSLAPVKRKLGSSTTSEPVGWGGAFKRGILDPPAASSDAGKDRAGVQQREGAALSPRKSSLKGTQEDGSPRKKARLLLEGKGVRVPGRESLGTAPGDIFLDDEDDDLEII